MAQRSPQLLAITVLALLTMVPQGLDPVVALNPVDAQQYLPRPHPDSQSPAMGASSRSPRLTTTLVRTPATGVKRLQFWPMPLSRRPTIANPLRGFCHPLDGRGLLSQGIRGLTHKGRSEYAYDLAVGMGTPVFAMRSGRIMGWEDKYPDTGGGASKAKRFNYVWIEHPGGYRSAYIHLQQGFQRRLRLQPGTWVKTGQLIGYSGNSGWSSGPHLHVEVQQPSRGNHFTKTVPFQISGHCRVYSI